LGLVLPENAGYALQKLPEHQMIKELSKRPDHKNFVRMLNDMCGLQTCNTLAVGFWSTKTLGASDIMEFLFRRGFVQDRWKLYGLSGSSVELYLSDLQALCLVKENCLGDRLQALHALKAHGSRVNVHAVRGLFTKEAILSDAWEAPL